ncbi:phytanoyl-CoA dioxygenase family protein [Nonomuraea soli]|uniref:Ectoine hydroxylase-related dioxygenase (Phytanoyl-CoA dioxygenase family) n=1 Tax=Nonomuraea soli TaxID=1032476 RepID=A0A7W0CQQ0_9ACTN|nr:phytanoyl-CoA dioxygenase family protein [Nonomuraea soli]MBA2895530.1 ectoine hydroxylase-related dioxygenase (phytanoyl-CoA dioxygenase family) [Nonomuraea soli]
MRTSDFHQRGYLVLPGLLSAHEVAGIRDEFMRLHADGPIPGHFSPTVGAEGEAYDVLREYPRVMHPHQVNELTMRYLLDPRIAAVLRELLGEEPIAAQSMFYFKPPGARGQALHQDNFYLRAEPGTCIAAWIAIDRVDRENGGLEVVPGTHAMDLFCPENADQDVSFTREYVPPPPGLERVPVDMEAGDVLFFNGSLVHGSEPNSTVDRFRRSLIFHYVGESTTHISSWYPTLRMSGEVVAIAAAVGGGPCGTEGGGVSGPH